MGIKKGREELKDAGGTLDYRKGWTGPKNGKDPSDEKKPVGHKKGPGPRPA